MLRNVPEVLLAPVVWIRRIGHTRGFGIQSPTDYWFVRYVINEHWPYYQYQTLGRGDDWLTRKIGKLCFRLANWFQPSVVESQDYRDYIQAGCHKALFGESTELLVMPLEVDSQKRLTNIYNKVSPQSVLVVTGIYKAWELWQQIVDDDRTGVTFDLYYCGIVMFDKKRHKTNYIINF